MFVISLCLGKLAVGLLFLRLSNARKQIRVALIIMCACILYGFTSFLLVAIRKPAAAERHMLSRWIAVAVMSDVIDAIMVIFPFFLVHGLQMRRASKFTVVAGFAMRLP